ncbi:MAG TPA: SpoIVB peptidase S55 domain-containing protein [Planctomycetota bacterium]|nr:SpoIVB peptidase S55 domain-containing protein [Planctomycetota bacterium]
MKSCLAVGLLLTTLIGYALAEQPAVKYCKMDDVRVGMKGVGKTVMNGSRIQEFDCEVIGILKKVFPNQDIIIARLSGLDIEKTGVIQGMSGSPIYVDGRLLGAVAYAWAFSKDSICGITPAEQMSTLISDINGDQGINLPLETRAPAFRPDWRGKADEQRNQVTTTGSMSFTRMRAPVVISGCPPAVFERLASRLDQMGMLPVQGGGQAADAGDAADLQPGSPVAIPLVDGDISVASIGTLTERVGNDVIGFGHPMMEMGRTELPLATAEINAIIPSSRISFKLGSVGKTVGTLLLDRTEGICGRIGKIPHLVPLTVKVNRSDFAGTTTHSYKIADNPYLTPFLIDICLYSSVFMKGGLPQEYTIDYTVRLVTEDGQPIVIREKVSSESYGAWAFFWAVTDTAHMIMNNPFKPTTIKEMSAEMNLKVGVQSAVIDSLRLASVKVAPGKTAKLAVKLRRYRRQYETLEVEVPIPADLPEGLYDVSVCDSNRARWADMAAAPALFQPTNYEEFMRMLRLQYPNEELYVRISMPGTGVSVRGTALPNLPGSHLSVLTPVGRTDTEFVGKFIKSSKATAYQIIGGQNVQMLVEKED